MRKVVLIESPYSGEGTEAIRYLAWCMLDSIMNYGEAPIASHAMYPLCLPEHVPFGDGSHTGRAIGLECNQAIAELHTSRFGYDTEQTYYPLLAVVRYVDKGVTPGMRAGADRRLQQRLRAAWERGEWPSKARWSVTNEGLS